jgi:CO/xanthine dehydrogenase FAD-binding subunit
MDLNTVSDVVAARSGDEVRKLQGEWRPGDAWLGGGTLLFSEPAPRLNRLVDLTTLDWPALTITDHGLEIAATCTITEISKAGSQMPADWLARPLFHECCTAFLASFKVWNLATLGGNLCAAFPAGPMISLTAALGGECEIWTPDGRTRREAVCAFVTGSAANTLLPGELLRAVHLPVSALRARTAFRKIALSPLGRSGVVIIGRLDPAVPDTVHVTVSSATVRPVVVDVPVGSSARAISRAIDALIPRELYTEDAHGAPDWRRQVTHVLADEVVGELSVPELGYPEAELDGPHEPRRAGEWGYRESGGDAA